MCVREGGGGASLKQLFALPTFLGIYDCILKSYQTFRIGAMNCDG